MDRNMSRRGVQSTCASKRAKTFKTWWLNESRRVVRLFTAALLILTLIVAPWLSFYGSYREHESRMLWPVNATILEHDLASYHAPSSIFYRDLDPPTGCLTMIIKHEGPTLPRLSESIQGFVSEYCVVDTGSLSNDNTIDI